MAIGSSEGPADAAIRAAYVTLLVDRETARLTSELKSSGVDPVLLKGPSLARWLYSDGESRRYGDIDLLVRPAEVGAAVTRLRELGYEDLVRSEVERAATPHARTLVRAGTQRLPSGTAARMPVDLHTSFHGVEADPATLWDALEPELETLKLGDVDVSIPGPRARTLFVALHAAAAGTAVEKPLRDLHRALERLSDDEWRIAFELAGVLRAESWFLAGLALAREGRALIDRCGFRARGRTRAELHAAGAPRVAVGLERLIATRGWRRRARLLARKLVPTADLLWMTSPLARRGRFGLALAYAVRPGWLAVRLPRAVVTLAAARRAARRRGDP